MPTIMPSLRAQSIAPAATIEISAKITEMRRQNQSIISLNIGEPDFAPPENARAAASAASEQGFAKYVEVSGILELRQAICEKLLHDNGLAFEPGDICVSAGAKQAIMNTLLAICDRGDEVLVPTPCWVSYVEMIKLAGATPVVIPCRAEEGFMLDPDAVEAAVTSRTRAIIINSPNNPTGAVYSRALLKRLAETALRHGFVVIADEVYEKMLYGDAEHVSIASLSDEIRDISVTVNSFSKTYAMPGWRLGYSACSSRLSKSIRDIQGHLTSSANTIAQRAGLAALTGPQEAVDEMCREYARRREYVLGRLKTIPSVKFEQPMGAFYFFPDVTACLGKSYGGHTVRTSVDLANYLLTEARIAVVPGEAFQGNGYLRISYANSLENITKGLDAMAQALAKLS